MKFLENPSQTMWVGFGLAIVLIVLYLGIVGISAGEADWFGLVFRWIHLLAGITWIGLLYFFNLINAAFLKSLDGPTKNIVIPKLMPSALNWFRHGATVTVLAGHCPLLPSVFQRGNGCHRIGYRGSPGHHHDGQCAWDYLAQPKKDHRGRISSGSWRAAASCRDGTMG